MLNFTAFGPISFFRLRHLSNALVYPGRLRPALGTPMAWHYSWHLIILIFALSFSFLHFPSDAISSYIHVRMRFSGPRRCVCSIVSWGLITAGTPTARCSRGGRIVKLDSASALVLENARIESVCFSGWHVRIRSPPGNMNIPLRM